MANSEVGSGYLSIFPKLDKGFKNTVGKGIDSAGIGKKVAAAIGSGVASAGVTAALGKTIKASFDEYKTYEQLAGGAQLLFGDAYDQVAEKAANAYKTVQLSQNDYLQQVNGLSTGLKTSMGGDAAAAADLADRIVQAEADVVAATGNSYENVSNALNGVMKSNFTMLDNLQLGITPTKEGMQEVIDKVNDWNKANGHATKYQMGNLADMESALVDYVEMQGMAGYAAGEAADTIEGSLAALGGAWSNWLSGLANDDADIGLLTENLVDSLMSAASNVVPRLGVIVGAIVQEIPPLLKQYGPQVADGLESMFLDAFSGTIGLADKALEDMGLGDTFDAIADNLEPVADGFERAGEAVEPLVREAMPALKEIFETVAPIVADAVGTIGDTIGDVVEIVAPSIEELGSVFMEDLWPPIKTTSTGFTDLFDHINGACKGIARAVSAAITGIVIPLLKKAAHPVKTLKSAFSTISSGVKSAFDKVKSILESAVNAIKGKIDKIKGFFANLKLKIPKIQLPHIPKMSVTWSTDTKLGKNGPTVKIPIPHISWNADGALFTKPVVFGNQGFGEAGPETALPLSRPRVMSKVGEAIAEHMPNSGMTVNMTVNCNGSDANAIAEEITNALMARVRMAV